MQLKAVSQGFTISCQDKLLLRHSEVEPAVFLGRGRERMEIHQGNFDIEDYVEERLPLTCLEVDEDRGLVRMAAGGREVLQLLLKEKTAKSFEISLQVVGDGDSFNRFWLRLPAEEKEYVWGCGEQMSYFNLRGRHFPLWTSEPGVGRDKSTLTTFRADCASHSGGDYYNTNYPQPTFISSRHYACHLDTTAYADFDFRQKNFHELQAWSMPEKVEFYVSDTFLGLVEQLSERFGRQPELPEWLYNGVVLGLKGGEENTFSRAENARQKGVPIAAVWSEDWAGVRETSFGVRNFWDWKWGKKRYPHLPQKIKELSEHGIRFMSYVSPYLCSDGSLFKIAEEHGYFATDGQGRTALVDFGEFSCGVIDFTNPEAGHWFAEEVIGKNLLDFGSSGWMADFGEYLPTEGIELYNGKSPKLMHNDWPRLWAKANAEAVASRGKTGEALFFMRSGAAGSQRYCPMLWGGDQSVDFSRHDGLGTVICGALSSGLMGNAYHHSDIGGYTSLYGNRRTKELFDRWVDMAAFTPMMRTHEGNRPAENFQFDQDAESLEHLAHMTRIYCHLAPYLKELSHEAATSGHPVQRPLFLHFEQDKETYGLQYEYLYGPDLLVAPVYQEGVKELQVYLPASETWMELWTGREIRGGQSVTVPCPIGQPPLFYRSGSKWRSLFEGIKDIS